MVRAGKWKCPPGTETAWMGWENVLRAEYLPLDIEEYRREGYDNPYLQECREYNAALPDEEDVSVYIEKIRRYEIIKEYAVPLQIEISNIGNTRQAT